LPIVFLHGITVREERFQHLVQTVRDGLALAGCSLGVTGFYWGDLGRSPGYRGVSIPGFEVGQRAAGLPGVARIPRPRCSCSCWRTRSRS
jgi:hypothetical protein